MGALTASILNQLILWKNKKHKHIINPYIFITQVQQLSTGGYFSLTCLLSLTVLKQIPDVLSLSISVSVVSLKDSNSASLFFCCLLKRLFFFFLNSVFRYTAKLRGKHRDFPYNPCSSSPSTINIPYQRGQLHLMNLQ